MAVSPVLLSIFVGGFLRYCMFDSAIADWLGEANEVVTPLTSWNRVVEGLALYKAGISPYTGDIFHEMPLMLRALSWINKLWGKSLHIVFIACDVLTALILERIASCLSRLLLEDQMVNVSKYHTDSSKLLLKASSLAYTRLYVVAAYLLNPLSLATCLAKSTGVFNNLIIALAIYFTLKGQKIRACVFIALASYISLYPIMFVVPAAIHIAQLEGHKTLQEKEAIPSMVRTVVGTVVVLAGLLYGSFLLEGGSWAFIQSTYGFILTVPDLTPNMGVFWYFFTEMFDHFRLFFICVFQINVFIYTVPLAIKLRSQPMFLMYSLLALMAIFKSYPSYADVSLYLALLPLWKHTSQYMRNSFLVACMLVVCTVLAPILYHLWINAGSANANFYFAISLVYSTAQIFLVADLIYAFLRREYCLLNGTKPPVIDGKPAQIILD